MKRILTKRWLLFVLPSFLPFTFIAKAQLLPGKIVFEKPEALISYGPGAAGSVIITVPVSGQSFTKALQVSTFNRPDAKSECGLKASIHRTA